MKKNALTKKQRKTLKRILIALAIFFVLEILTNVAHVFDALPAGAGLWVQFALFLVPYLLAGYDVLAKAWHGIVHRQPFDENLLMAIATLGAFALVFFPEAEPHMAEGAAVMLFYQVGELFQDYAVGKSRQSIAALMDIRPDTANLEAEDGSIQEVDPEDVAVGDVIVVKPGERVPLDGTVLTGESQIDTAALTGESVPRTARPGDEVISGCVNLTAKLVVLATKPFEDSTVSKILDLVENASEKKSTSEHFITRFARYYTPCVVIAAALLFALPSLALALLDTSALPGFLTGTVWQDWLHRALIFLVISCPWRPWPIRRPWSLTRPAP